MCEKIKENMKETDNNPASQYLVQRATWFTEEGSRGSQRFGDTGSPCSDLESFRREFAKSHQAFRVLLVYEELG